VSNNTRDSDGERPEDAEAGAGAAPYTYGDPEAAVDHLAEQAKREKMRRIEALLFASKEPLDEKAFAIAVEPGDDVAAMLADLQADYARRGVNLIQVAGKWQFRTADDLSYLLERQQKEERRLSKAALETLAIIAYHQPVTRAEIEEIRGVSTSPGTLDVLMECEWIRPRGRRRAPGRPLTFGTTETFLAHFGLASIKDLPGLADLKASGLLDANLPPDFKVPEPTDIAALMPDELPLTDDGVEDEDEADQDELPLQDEDEAAKPDDGEAGPLPEPGPDSQGG
jgi:segregation and condensation protein B